jgi:hypothetical protein
MFVYLRQTLCQKKISFLSEIILSRLSDGNRIMPLLKELGCRGPFYSMNHKQLYIPSICALSATLLAPKISGKKQSSGIR